MIIMSDSFLISATKVIQSMEKSNKKKQKKNAFC